MLHVSANHASHWTLERQNRVENEEPHWSTNNGKTQPSEFNNNSYTFFCEHETDSVEACPSYEEMAASGDYSKWYCHFGEFGYNYFDHDYTLFDTYGFGGYGYNYRVIFSTGVELFEKLRG